MSYRRKITQEIAKAWLMVSRGTIFFREDREALTNKTAWCEHLGEMRE